MTPEIKRKLIVTLSNKGCRYLDKDYSVDSVDVKDMTGAGDTFLSGLVSSYIDTEDIEKSIQTANEYATIIVQQKGVKVIGDYL